MWLLPKTVLKKHSCVRSGRLFRPDRPDINFMLDSRNICIYIARLNGSLTQQVEYLPFKQRVAGSNPARPTKFTSHKAPQRLKSLAGLSFYTIPTSHQFSLPTCTYQHSVGIFVGIFRILKADTNNFYKPHQSRVLRRCWYLSNSYTQTGIRRYQHEPE